MNFIKEVDAWYETVGRIAASKECPQCHKKNIDKRYRQEPNNCAFETYCKDCGHVLIAILD